MIYLLYRNASSQDSISQQAVRLHVTQPSSSSMAAFMDLNVSFSAEKSRMKSLIEAAAHLGFSTVAINYVFEPTAKKKLEIPKPTPVQELMGPLPVVQGRSRPIRVLNRLTVVMSDASHFRPNATEYRGFDLLAVQPTTEKLFHAACLLYDVDIICISVTEKLPFFFKRAPVNGAIDRGVVFEVSYSAAIRDSTRRRYTIANAVSLMESCKGKNVILSSAAEKPLELRGPYDITNLLLLLLLLSGRIVLALRLMTTCCPLSESRKSASGIIYTMKTCSESSSQQGAPAADCEAPAAKRVKPHLPQ
ncbi:ribonuclease P protein subunit p30 [Pseudoliparis swirei]|uniref:ribonuclease P protein subunit p30 n=1 Tax=Pseudoliparis swirei TaxID=2059687 RepID=UPI0024BD7A69|nr:ribonuclease P protein subunit p30 [Pseudoliparis swirei]